MMEWAENLSESLDNKLVCKNCGMAYQNDENIRLCPWCDKVNNILHVTGYNANEKKTGEYTREFSENEIHNIPERILNGADMNNPDVLLFSISIESDKYTVKIMNDNFAIYIANTGQRIYGSYETSEENIGLIAEDIMRKNKYRMEVEIL